jgi:Spy/CpxP family protein refolding chaperone
MKKRTLMILAASIFSTTAAWSQTGMGGYGMGPDMRRGAASDGASGPGMMEGRGRGHGSGMMGGYGMGMMGDCGPGNWGPNVPDLTTEQQNKIAAIQKEMRQKQWALMEKMHEDARPGMTYQGGKFDEQAARKAFDARANLHKQMFENALEAHKRMDAVLTPRQREQLQR